MSIMNILEYKGYHGKVECNVEDMCICGQVLGINALVTFESDNLKGIEQAFKDSVDNYLDLCQRNNLEAEKEYSGQFSVRINSDTHRKLCILAEARGKKLNAVVNAACDQYGEANRTQHKSYNITLNYFDQETSIPITPIEYRTDTQYFVVKGGEQWQRNTAN